MRRADGATMWAILSARAILIGGQLAMLVTITDITERKAAQVELEEREERFRAIAEGVPLSVLISRTEPSEILFANARALETFGLRVGPGLRGDPGGLPARRRSGAAARQAGQGGRGRRLRCRDEGARRDRHVVPRVRSRRRFRRPAGGADRDHRHHPAARRCSRPCRRARPVSPRSWRTRRSACI